MNIFFKKDRLNIFFIFNPISGGINKDRLLSVFDDFCRQNQYRYASYKTTGKDDKSRIEDFIQRDEYDVIAVSGGDGTINMVGPLLKDKDLPMLIIPGGSANGLATELAIPDNILQALNLLKNGKIKIIDAIIINNRNISYHLCDLGFNARIIEYFEKENQRGFVSYFKNFFSALRRTRPSRFRIIDRSKSYFVKANMIVIANARTYGTGALINDIGKIDDGHFEVIAIKRVRFWQIFSFIGSFFIGNISQLPFVKAFSLRYVKVYNLDDQPFQIDGEYQGKQSEIEVTIDPGALKIIVPD